MKKEIGVVGVDSGQLILCDPCYLSRWINNEYDSEAKKNDFSYSRACQLTLSEEQGGQLFFDAGHAGQAVAFSSGFGDGVYPVIATYKNYGTKDQPDIRIKKVEILLIKD